MDRSAKALDADGSSSVDRRNRLPIAGIVFGAWALLPPYTGPALATSTRVEIADHVVPGIVMLLTSIAVLGAARGRSLPVTALLAAGLTVSLAGLWMTSTHLPLVLQAARAEAPWAAAIYHTAPGLAVLALGFIWARSYWSEAG